MDKINKAIYNNKKVKILYIGGKIKMRAFNKKNKRNTLKIEEKWGIEIILENVETFFIPMKYVSEIKKRKNKIKYIKISKKYLEAMEYSPSYSDDILEEKIERFLNARDITRIYINNKLYFMGYIDDYCDRLGADNVLQSIKIEDKNIVFSWDLNKKNCVDYKGYPFISLTISSKYKGKVFDYGKVKYF